MSTGTEILKLGELLSLGIYKHCFIRDLERGESYEGQRDPGISHRFLRSCGGGQRSHHDCP